MIFTEADVWFSGKSLVFYTPVTPRKGKLAFLMENRNQNNSKQQNPSEINQNLTLPYFSLNLKLWVNISFTTILYFS